MGHIVSRGKSPANDTDLALKRRKLAVEPENDAAPRGSEPTGEGWTDPELQGEADAALGAEGATADVEVDGDVTGEIEVFTAERTDGDLTEGAQGDADADPDAEDLEEIEVAAESKSEDEPASFLAMYFRDMAELDVLRPEQEFETAREIEEMEIDLWQTLLGFTPGAVWLADAIEPKLEKPLAEFKKYRTLAEAKRRTSKGVDPTVATLAAKLRVLDIDRIYLETALAEVQRVGRSLEGLPFEGTVSFPTNTKMFREYVEAVARKATALKTAKNEFVKANLRLVVSIARRFNHGRLPLADLIQEGNIGLMKAVERYDYRRGFRFSTYASWWIRHAISRALADKGRAVRLPVHMIDAYHRIAKSQRELQSKLERPPTTNEISAATGIEPEKLEKMKTFLAESPVSLDRPVSDEDGRRLIDVLTDPNEAPSVPEQMASSETQTEMLKILADLKPIEADILRKRFGLANDREKTLKEIGDEYHLSRERVRQLQEQALGKMRRAMAKREML
jgi:RNA polymerase primary sigma factor